MLGVDSESTATELKRAYLTLAKQHHPDVNSDPKSEKYFSEINEAYETLGNQEKRDIYDSTGMSSNEQQSSGQTSGYGFNPFGFAFRNQKPDMRDFD